MMWFKVLDGLSPIYGDGRRYPGVGRWTRHLDPNLLDPCRYGFHLAKDSQLLGWLGGPTIYEAEPCPEHPPVDADDKWVTCRVRLVRKLTWDDRVARLFAADCAEAALLGERACGREADGRSWEAVRVARRYADGGASDGELGAARDAAGAAAGAAASAAAWAAASAAAGAAARAAPWGAAWAAARDAAEAAARGAARAAARAAPWGAAEEAAEEAASAAAMKELMGRLTVYLDGQTPPPPAALYGPDKGP
jgi:hypothetical protein